MRTLYPAMVVLCLGFATLIFTGSGFAGLYEQSPTDDMTIGDKVESQANNSSVNKDRGFEGTGSESDNIIGFVVAAGGRIMSIVSLLVLLPWEMTALGFPTWFALPIGGLFQLVAGIGIIQFFAGRFWR